MTTACDPAFVALAHQMADVSGPIARRYFRTPLAVDDKADMTPVTRADREAEAALRELIEARFPAHGIIGEEYGRVREDAEYVWVLDPIDGTRGFIAGLPLFGTLIGLLHGGRPILGMIDHPATGDRWVGAAGAPTTHNGKAAHVRACAALEQATLYATAPDMFSPERDVAFARVQARVKNARFGTDCYAYGLVAGGFGDLAIEGGMQVYDFMPLVPVVEGAGGTMTDWTGAPLTLASGDAVIAAGDARMHAAALALLRE